MKAVPKSELTHAATLILLCVSSASVFAAKASSLPEDIDSGNFMYEMCKGGSTGRAECVLYTAGLAQGIAIQAIANKQTPSYCKPDKVTYGQVADIFIKALHDEPALRHLPAAVIFYGTMVKVFPCE
ncbi:hypothetical protein LSG25_07775 [Paralcaligenes sp. KSB-10]|uniref:Rap1a/Tai family immunity protein n=1 Tax=Paralcaligenes sp. KSB-10 TaxID=2901142 RepID=UPI001E4C48B5|nr:Rap1a/Tai family immunity protein [Paralcaligenes sp. KSB-10]UHL65763.1 hypothetical protein LSG25_07775 [Paralcaligenes sp. KSB-10]